jgi:hypothetical protein
MDVSKSNGFESSVPKDMKQSIDIPRTKPKVGKLRSLQRKAAEIRKFLSAKLVLAGLGVLVRAGKQFRFAMPSGNIQKKWHKPNWSTMSAIRCKTFAAGNFPPSPLVLALQLI